MRKKQPSLPKCLITDDGELVCTMKIHDVMYWARYQDQDGVWLLMESDRMPEDILGDYHAWSKNKFVLS